MDCLGGWVWQILGIWLAILNHSILSQCIKDIIDWPYHLPGVNIEISCL